MDEYKSLVDNAIRDLATGVPKTYGVISQGERGISFLGLGGQPCPIIYLYLLFGNQFQDEKSFSGNLIFRRRERKKGKDPSFVLMDENFNYLSSSNTMEQSITAIIIADSNNYKGFGETPYDRVPIGIKLSFSVEGRAVAIVKDSDIVELWMIEGERLRSLTQPDLNRESGFDGFSRHFK